MQMHDQSDACGVSHIVPSVCPLNDVQPGTTVRVMQLNVSVDTAVRLREMGFCEQQRIRMLARNSQVICQVCNTRLGLSEKLAQTILVEPLAA